MAATIYLLCALTSLTCFGLLWRAWRASRSRLLFWSALCFAGLSLNNFLVVVDLPLFTTMDFSTWRLLAALLALLLMLYGLIWEEE